MPYLTLKITEKINRDEVPQLNCKMVGASGIKSVRTSQQTQTAGVTVREINTSLKTHDPKRESYLGSRNMANRANDSIKLSLHIYILPAVTWTTPPYRIVCYLLNALCKFRENWLKRLGGDRATQRASYVGFRAREYSRHEVAVVVITTFVYDLDEKSELCKIMDILGGEKISIRIALWDAFWYSWLTTDGSTYIQKRAVRGDMRICPENFEMALQFTILFKTLRSHLIESKIFHCTEKDEFIRKFGVRQNRLTHGIDKRQKRNEVFTCIDKGGMTPHSKIVAISDDAIRVQSDSLAPQSFLPLKFPPQKYMNVIPVLSWCVLQQRSKL
ncbi:hypothetical protein C0J52_19068 [Blattella germanica]|nr:hypothetical protein C0J52_19068 [Blattella germanica]